MDQGKEEFSNGGIVVFLDPPVTGSAAGSFEFGIDLYSWTVGPKFRGLGAIPPGLHFIYYRVLGKKAADVDSKNEYCPVYGHFVFFGKGQLVVLKWDRETEEAVLVQNLAELEHTRSNLREIAPFLGPYPHDQSAMMHTWHKWTRFIQPSTINRILKPCLETGHPLSSMNTSYHGREEINRLNKLASLPRSTDTDPNSLSIHFTEFDLKQSIPPRLPNANLDAQFVTRYSLDKSLLLQSTLEQLRGPKEFLGELQLSFLLLMVVQNFEGFEQWKQLVNLCCHSPSAIAKQAGLYAAFLDVLRDQLEQSPENFFGDILTEANTLFLWLSELSQDVQQVLDKESARSSGEAGMIALAKSFAAFTAFALDKFRWDLLGERAEPEDEQPTLSEDK